MKYYILLFVLLCGCAVENSSSFLFKKNEFVYNVCRSIVKIHILSYAHTDNKTSYIPFYSADAPTTQPKLIMGYMSGVVIKNDIKNTYILTAAHGFKYAAYKNNGVWISNITDEKFIDNNVREAKIVYINYETDLCILSCERFECSAINVLNNKYPELLSNVFIMGYPSGGSFYISRATIAGYMTVDNLIRIRFDGTVRPGNSGGAILDNKGNLIGIVTNRFDNNDGIGLSGYSINIELKKLKF